jgi:hypothetical protein
MVVTTGIGRSSLSAAPSTQFHPVRWVQPRRPVYYGRRAKF